VVKRERNHEEHEGNTRSSQSIRAKSFNLCSPCAIEERHTDETDSTYAIEEESTQIARIEAEFLRIQKHKGRIQIPPYNTERI
jgi:hypothetical protein